MNYYNYAIVINNVINNVNNNNIINNLKFWVPLFYTATDESELQRYNFYYKNNELRTREFMYNIFYMGDALYIPSLLLKLGFFVMFHCNSALLLLQRSACLC